MYFVYLAQHSHYFYIERLEPVQPHPNGVFVLLNVSLQCNIRSSGYLIKGEFDPSETALIGSNYFVEGVICLCDTEKAYPPLYGLGGSYLDLKRQACRASVLTPKIYLITFDNEYLICNAP